MQQQLSHISYNPRGSHVTERRERERKKVRMWVPALPLQKINSFQNERGSSTYKLIILSNRSNQVSFQNNWPSGKLLAPFLSLCTPCTRYYPRAYSDRIEYMHARVPLQEPGVLPSHLSKQLLDQHSGVGTPVETKPQNTAPPSGTKQRREYRGINYKT